MLKWPIPDVVWGALFGIFVTIVGIGATIKYLPSPQEAVAINCRQPTIQTQEKSEYGEESTKEATPAFQNSKTADLKNKSEGQKDEYECLIAKYIGNLANVTQWLVAVTLLLAFFGFWQVMVSRNTASCQLRAYMGGAVLADKNIYAPQFLAQMVVTNSGQTPAYDVSVGCKMSAYDNPLPDGFSFEAVPYRLGGPRYIVNPDSKHTILVEAKPPLMPEDKVAIKEGKKCLYLWGEIRYRDAFAKHRFARYKRTRFRLVWLHKRGIGMWSYCDDGNDAT